VTADRTRRDGLLAASLLLVSAALQTAASLIRWLGPTTGPGGMLIEDHLYDYFVPAPPWVNLGYAAQLFGFGELALAAAVIVLALESAKSSSVLFRAFAVVLSLPFAVVGVHAVLSGVLGSPSVLFYPLIGGLAFTVFSVAAPIALAIVTARRSIWWALASILMAGATLPGYLVATFAIAPAVAGYQSFDTTPWSETVVAVFVALAAASVAVGALTVARRPVDVARDH
jgi:hypothetical protein